MQLTEILVLVDCYYVQKKYVLYFITFGNFLEILFAFSFPLFRILDPDMKYRINKHNQKQLQLEKLSLYNPSKTISNQESHIFNQLAVENQELALYTFLLGIKISNEHKTSQQININDDIILQLQEKNASHKQKKLFKKQYYKYVQAINFEQFNEIRVGNQKFLTEDTLIESLDLEKNIKRLKEKFNKMSQAQKKKQCYSEGKGGSFMFFTYNKQIILKEIEKDELKVLSKNLGKFVSHFNNYPNTLINKILGVYKFTNINKKKTYIMMIQNICYQNPGQLQQIVTYDLKGSQTGRQVLKTQEKQKQIKEKINNQLNVEQVLKDIDFNNIQQNIQISDQQQLKAIKNQIFKDAEFLSSLKLMDYSLVISQYVVSDEKKESNTSNKDFDDFSEQSDKDGYLNNHCKLYEQKAKSFENSQIQYFKRSQNEIKIEKNLCKKPVENQDNEDVIISNSQPQNFYFTSDYKQKQKYDNQNNNRDSLIKLNNLSINNNINDQEIGELINEEQQFLRQKSQINLCNNASLLKNIPLKKQISDQINQFSIKQTNNNWTHKHIINPIIINQNKGQNQFGNNIKKSNIDNIQCPQKITNYSQFQLQNRQKIFYYIGIIDYLQTYNTFKKLQYYTDFSGKGSSKPPDKYGKTFIKQNINIFKLQNQFQSQQE